MNNSDLNSPSRPPSCLQIYLSSIRGMKLTSKFGGLVQLESMDDDISNYPQGLVLVPRGADDGTFVVGPHVRGGRLRAASATGDKEVDLLLPGTARYGNQTRKEFFMKFVHKHQQKA